MPNSTVKWRKFMEWLSKIDDIYQYYHNGLFVGEGDLTMISIKDIRSLVKEWSK